MLFLKSSIELFHFEKSSNLKEDFEKRKKEGPPFFYNLHLSHYVILSKSQKPELIFEYIPDPTHHLFISRYGSDGCRRTYLSERDLNAHVDFRHLKQPQTSSSNNLPSTEAINAATAALAATSAEQNVQSHRGGGSGHKMRTSNQNNLARPKKAPKRRLRSRRLDLPSTLP